MSKPTDQILIVPGESGWEIWAGQSSTGFTLHAATAATRAGDITGLPAGDLIMLFPVKAVTAIPMKVACTDESLYPDLAAMHAERLGLRPDPMAGQLSDVFLIGKDAESAALLAVHLRPPVDGDLPNRGPKEFDLAARALPMPGDCLAVWQEFGRWVFALSHLGKLVYCQATSATSRVPDDSLVREIRLAIIQLALQEIDLSPDRVLLWTSAEEASPGALSGAFDARVEVAPRPAPELPDPRSKLLPADVRAARRAAQRRRNIALGVAAVILAYLGGIGYFAYDLWKVKTAATAFRKEAEAVAPDRQAYLEHQARWAELTPAIDLKHSPVEIMWGIHNCIPKTGGLRLKIAKISDTEINLTGEAVDFGATTQFSKNLRESNDLISLKWDLPGASTNARGWEFHYNAAPPKSDSAP